MDRTILHCDCNGFFASVECVINPKLREVPMAVGGDSTTRHGIILAKNELAKKYNILTAEPIGRALNKCPNLVIVPPHHKLYEEYSDMVNKIYLEYTDQAEKFGIDETWLDVTRSLRLFGSGKIIADTLRERVRKETGLTISVGVSFNKIFSKLGSDYKKPDATTVILRGNYKDIVYPMSVDALLFVGRKTVLTLKKLYIETIGDLASADPVVLRNKLGKMGEMLWIYARGDECEAVRFAYDKEDIKSVGKGRTFPADLADSDDIRREIYVLADNISARLRKHNKKCTTVQVHIKNPEFKVVSKQKTLELSTSSANIIAGCAYEIFIGMKENFPVIRAITITAVNLVDAMQGGQLSLTDNLNLITKNEDNLGNTVDKLRMIYGDNVIVRGSSL